MVREKERECFCFLQTCAVALLSFMFPGKEILPLKAINIKILSEQNEYKTGAKAFLRFIPADANNHLGPLLDPLPSPWPLYVGVVL